MPELRQNQSAFLACVRDRTDLTALSRPTNAPQPLPQPITGGQPTRPVLHFTRRTQRGAIANTLPVGAGAR